MILVVYLRVKEGSLRRCNSVFLNLLLGLCRCKVAFMPYDRVRSRWPEGQDVHVNRVLLMISLRLREVLMLVLVVLVEGLGSVSSVVQKMR